MLQRSTHLSVPLHGKSWLWFNLLSLDAPLVAVTWQILFAECLHVTISPLSVAALALTVWVIYAIDRLLDVSRGTTSLRTERHRFHKKHVRSIVIAVIASVAALIGIAAFLRPLLLRSGSGVAAIVALYFAFVHALPRSVQEWCPKELAVGIVFAIGTCLAPWTRLADAHTLAAPAALFAALCCLNCAAIEVWEWSRFGASAVSRPHRLTVWLSQHLRSCALLIALFGFLLLFVARTPALFAAIILSAVAFAWLDVEKRRLSVDALRVLADVPLLSPLLLLIGLR